MRWATRRMTADYTLRDLGTLLRQEGYFLTSAEISVVLTRLKGRGEIEEIKPGQGRTPAVFRKPTVARVAESDPADEAFAAPRRRDVPRPWRAECLPAGATNDRLREKLRSSREPASPTNERKSPVNPAALRPTGLAPSIVVSS